MNPFLSYLGDVAASMPPPNQTAAPYAPMLAANNPAPQPAPAPPPPPAGPKPAPEMLAKNEPITYTPEQEQQILRAGFTPAQAAAAGFKFPDEPLKTSGQRMRDAMQANGAAQPAAAAPAAERREPPPVTFAGGGGTVPAHEVERRGPSLIAAQNESNAMTAGAIDAIHQRTEQAAAIEGAMAAGQVRQAYARQEGAEQEAAAREAELQQRQADFDSSVRALSKMSVDPNRFWASRNTGQKISAFVGIALGGFLQGAHGGGPNPGLDIINTQIDRDIRAQEFAYQAARDTAGMKQTAFALAMQKYQNVDAARAMARAAALDAVQAQLMQTAAMWKGTEAGNRADLALAQLQKDKENQIAQGIAFIPATATARMYLSPEGIPMTEAEAKAFYNTERERNFNLGMEGVRAGLKEGEKTQDEAAKGAQYISKELGSEGIPEALRAAEDARQALVAHPLGTMERGTHFVAPYGGLVHKELYGREAQEREQSWDAFKTRAIKAIAGARGEGSAIVAERMKSVLDGAGDNESRLHAIKQVEAVLRDQEANVRGGASVAAQKKFDEQRGAATPGGAAGISNTPGFKPK